MHPIWRISLLILMMFQAESHKTGLPSIGKEINDWMTKLQDAVLPLPPDLVQNVTRRTSELCLPTLVGPGKCRTHSKHTVERLMQSDQWALAMLDSSSRLRFGPGLMDGRIQDLGNYDQCLRVREPEGKFVGQQCLVQIEGVLPPNVSEFFGASAHNVTFPGNHLIFSLCVPSSCENDDVRTHVIRTLELAKISSATNIHVFCRSAIPSPFRTKDWCAIAFFATIPLLVLISTVYEHRTSGKKSELLSSFSVLSNWKKLTNNQVAPDIPCLDGLRIICALAVLNSHRYFLYIFMPYFNFQTFLEERATVLYAILINGSIATDTFFVIFGLNRTYSFLRQRHEGKTLHHGYQSLKRYFRLTPVLAVTILYSSTVSIHMADGPLWDKCVGFEQELCNHLWFLNLLHLSNWLLYRCRVESWYIASEFQLFLLSPLLLRPLFTRPRLGFFLLASTFSLSTLLKMISSYIFLLYPDVTANEGRKPLRDFSTAHCNTVYRLGAFVMGVALGYLLYEIKHGRRKFTLSKRTVWLGWVLTAAVFCATPALRSVYLQPDYEDDPWMSVFYVGLWERVFVVAVCWLILACATGNGGWVNNLLSLPVLRPFAKLTFSIYLSHMSIQILHMFRSRQPLDFVVVDTLFLGIADLVAATGVGLVLYLAIEMPFYRVASYVLQDKLVVRPASTQKKSQPKEKYDVTVLSIYGSRHMYKRACGTRTVAY